MDELTRDRALTVSVLSRYISAILDADPVLTQVHVRGELSNFKRHSSGHLYFTLKDSEAQIRCVMFRSQAVQIKCNPADGMHVILRGRVAVWQAAGQYQLYVTSLEPDGIGALYLAYEALKKKLETEGLFAPERKRPLPLFPKTIGIVTSPTGAAIQDMTRILSRRYPLAQVILYPALVQGQEAVPQLVAGIRYFSSHPTDLIIIGRGGGSMEDLWCFNDESLAREIAQCQIPIISAVGHEIDFTICDFVADVRAATPSAAAELAVPDQNELYAKLTHYSAAVKSGVSNSLLRAEENLRLRTTGGILREPMRAIADRRLKLDMLSERCTLATDAKIRELRHAVASLAGRLDSLNPLSVLARGYAILSDESERTIISVSGLHAGDRVVARLSDGTAKLTVNSAEAEKE